MSDESERRDFLKGAASAALGVIATDAVAGPALAAPTGAMTSHQMPVTAAAGRRQLSIYARPGITINELTGALRAAIGGHGGCRTCGLNGLDLHVGLGDPPTQLAATAERIQVQSPHIGGIVLGPAP